MSNSLGDMTPLGAVLQRLAATIDVRAESGADKSYTAQLLAKGPDKIAAKIIEEGGELAEALLNESDTAVASEAADVLYHILVGLRARGIRLEDVANILAAREGTSGLEEKASRSS